MLQKQNLKTSNYIGAQTRDDHNMLYNMCSCVDCILSFWQISARRYVVEDAV